jgi:hypothetical protein
MKFTTQILFAIATFCLFVTGALWGSHSVVNAQSSAGNPVKVLVHRAPRIDWRERHLLMTDSCSTR